MQAFFSYEKNAFFSCSTFVAQLRQARNGWTGA